jgi:hypothetical protein
VPVRVADKMGIRAGERLFLVHAPRDAVSAIDLPAVNRARALRGKFDHIVFFTREQADLDATFQRLKAHLTPNGKLWVAWPKAGKLGTDLNVKQVIRIGYSYGLVESVNLRIDATWTALKFTWPKANKVYKNSYGKLDQTAP